MCVCYISLFTLVLFFLNFVCVMSRYLRFFHWCFFSEFCYCKYIGDFTYSGHACDLVETHVFFKGPPSSRGLDHYARVPQEYPSKDSCITSTLLPNFA